LLALARRQINNPLCVTIFGCKKGIYNFGLNLMVAVEFLVFSKMYHAHPPVGCFSFRRLVGMDGSGPVRPVEPYDKRIRRP
jgi:hypothetical protein